MSEEQESKHLAVIRAWAALAWADGIIQDEERTAITRLVEVARLTDDEREKALAMLDSKVELETESLESLPQSARESIYRAALRLAMVDLDMAAEEAIVLHRLRKGLLLSDEQATAIEKSLSAEGA